MGVLESRSEELGGYMVEFTSFREDADATALFKGLPDDRCRLGCVHVHRGPAHGLRIQRGREQPGRRGATRSHLKVV